MIGLRLESRNDRNLISSSIDFLTSAASIGVVVMAEAESEAENSILTSILTFATLATYLFCTPNYTWDVNPTFPLFH